MLFYIRLNFLKLLLKINRCLMLQLPSMKFRKLCCQCNQISEGNSCYYFTMSKRWKAASRIQKMERVKSRRKHQLGQSVWKIPCRVSENIISLNSELKEAKWQIMEKSARLEKSQRKIIDLEARSRQNNIRIVGFEEGSETGDLLDYFANLFQSLFPDILPQPPDIGRANRIFTLKPRNPDKPRNFSQLAFSRIQVPPVFSVTNEAEIFILHQIGWPSPTYYNCVHGAVRALVVPSLPKAEPGPGNQSTVTGCSL
ncbi:uncharacterized protein LOC132386071 isoform X2 [Hypanus sabinus]|uniref:uncharacterized protein LOC132386071 isoform X2 n=1 Tax=Hypanus sabinus TaxID=79690 RepID=UPI0028C4CE22|nr:uncharacterized protein LOC132386071 isoform X2 [Hypanus sabinus]XP_059814343.1 uncharacterized protein LOC132386071 isoform X2 [Hypanus sabinus]